MKITLKAARVNNGMTQLVAAEKLGITKETLANYELGKTSPTIRIMRSMECLYGISYDQINFLESDQL